MLEGEVLIAKGFGTVDGSAAGAVAVEEISALDHELLNLPAYELLSETPIRTVPLELRRTYHAVELAALVSLGPSLRILGFTRAELTKVLGCARSGIGKQFHLDPAEWLSYMTLSRPSISLFDMGHRGREACICQRKRTRL